MNPLIKILASRLALSSDMAKDFVHDADKRLCCIDYDATVGYVFFCGV